MRNQLNCFPKQLHHFMFPNLAMYEGSNFSTSCFLLIIVNYSSGYGMVSHCSFDLHFPNDDEYLYVLIIGHLCFSWRNIYSNLCPFVIKLSFYLQLRGLYIFWYKSLNIAVPNLSAPGNSFLWKIIFYKLNGIVWGWFMCITFIVHLIPIIITSATSLTSSGVRSQRLENPCLVRCMVHKYLFPFYGAPLLS